MVIKYTLAHSRELQDQGCLTVKIKCVKFDCEVCTKLASIQVFYNKKGDIRYARARHYTGTINGKPQFQYHQQSLEYIKSKLSEMPQNIFNIAEIGHMGQQINNDLEKPQLTSKLAMAGPMGFEPMTFSLEG